MCNSTASRNISRIFYCCGRLPFRLRVEDAIKKHEATDPSTTHIYTDGSGINRHRPLYHRRRIISIISKLGGIYSLCGSGNFNHAICSHDTANDSTIEF